MKLFWPTSIAIAILVGLFLLPAPQLQNPFGEVSPPPPEEVERLDLDPFYQKHLSYRGFPIVGSENVSDYAFYEAAYLIEKMLGNRPDVLAAIVENKVRLSIMTPNEFTTDIPEHSDLDPPAYWDKRARGLGATKVRPAVSVGEENLLGFKGDPYATESIMVHEFAHVIHQMGVNAIDPNFQKKLEKTFNRASIAGLWESKYAGTNPAEYWAEGVQSWFDTNRENDFEHNHVNTREELIEHDPGLANLIKSVFGDDPWRYQTPPNRIQNIHLVGYDPETAPTFQWPAEIVAAYEAHQRGDDREKIEFHPMASLEKERRSQSGGKSVSLRFLNKSKSPVSLHWVDMNGKKKSYASIDPDRNHEQQTFGNHLWIVTDKKSQKEIGWLRATDKKAQVEIVDFQ